MAFVVFAGIDSARRFHFVTFASIPIRIALTCSKEKCPFKNSEITKKTASLIDLHFSKYRLISQPWQSFPVRYTPQELPDRPD